MSTPVAERVSTARKELGFRYKSPAQTEIDLKTQEVEKKKKEVSFLSEKYNNLSKEYQPRMFRDTSKSICGNCHLRGHDKKRCPGEKFDRALICGEIDKHPSEKKELSEIGKKKQAAEIELKTLKTELEIKTRILNEVQCSFETKIHDQLIDSDPDRYLTALAKPKEGLVKADTYILKRYYQGKVPENLKEESQIWKTIITSYEEKMKIRPPKLNCVQRELERRGGIPWPQQQDQNANQNTADSCTSTGQEYQQECQFRQPFPYNYLAYGQNYMYAYPGYMGYNSGIAQRQYGVPPSATITSPHQATPFMPMMSPMASPPPPPDEAGEDTELPPLPDKTAK